MSLTRHIRNNSAKWELLSNLIDVNKTFRRLQQVNALCASKNLIRPSRYDLSVLGEHIDYPWKTVGGALTYLPVAFNPDLLEGSYMDRYGQKTDMAYIKKLDPVSRLIACSLWGSHLRENGPKPIALLRGNKSLPGDPGVLWPLVYKDVESLISGSRIVGYDWSLEQIAFNVPPLNAWWVDGADIQLQVSQKTVISFTTVRSEPLTYDKLAQAIAYMILDLVSPNKSLHDWDQLVFSFPRHQVQIELDWREYLLPYDHANWATYWEAVSKRRLTGVRQQRIVSLNDDGPQVGGPTGFDFN